MPKIGETARLHRGISDPSDNEPAEGGTPVPFGLLARFRPLSLRARVQASIERGTGLHRGEWLLDELPLDAASLDRVTEDLLSWCRERIAETRRPYGIDQLALAVACAEPGGPALASRTFGVFRPVEFYADGGVAERVADFVRSIRVDELNRGNRTVRLAAALFSWGDVAREAAFPDETPS